MLQHALWFAVLLGAAQATVYPKLESWAGSSFMNGFKFDPSIYDNTTNGDVFWATAQNTSLLYATSSGTFVMKVDNTSDVVYNQKRYAPKLLSKTAYTAGTVWVLDALHMPYGCSVWPALWTQGPNWPAGGEIDIMEGINLQTTNQVALHADGSSCIAGSGTTQSGSLTYNNCSIAANSGTGCTVDTSNTATYGAGFDSAGGGVYVCEWTNSVINVWFLSRSAVPSNLTVGASSIDTASLGTPLAQYGSSSCNFAQYFGPQTLTIDITLCGDWAGVASLLEETCPTLVGTNTCYTTYVINDASTTYANAYFEFNYVNVFSSSSSSSSNSSGASSTVTGGVSSSTSAKSAANARWENARSMGSWAGVGVGMLAVVLGMGMVL